MHRDPGQRFPTADAFARALRGAAPPDAVVLPGPATGPAPTELDPGAGATRTFGPRPPRPEPAAPRRRRLPWAVAIVGLVAGGLLFLVRGPLGWGDDDCAPQDPLSVSPGGNLVEGDVDGDGCSVQGIYQLQPVADAGNLMVLTIDLGGRRQQLQLGEPGDQLVLGDWDCDGLDTPGLYKPAAGVVQYYDRWPAVAAVALQPDRTETVDTGGRAELAEGNGTRCDRISVTPPGESSGSVPEAEPIAAGGASAAPA
jgi:hypothetical protein